MKKILKYFIDRPLLVNLLFASIIIMGIVCTFLMRRESLPSVDMRELTITTSYPGASAKDVELNVTIPIEKQLKSVTGIKQYRSISMENLSKITIKLDDNSDNPEKIKQDIRRAVDSTVDLPSEITEKPIIKENKTRDIPIIEVALSSATYNEKELVTRAKILKKALQELTSVSKIETQGIRKREIQIKINLNKLNAAYLSFQAITDALKKRNINMAGGNLESYRSEKGIVTVSRFKNIHDVGNTILRSNFEGHQILLRDVATIIDTFEKKEHIIRYNGKKGVALSIIKKEKADIIRTIEAVQKVVTKFKKSSAGKKIAINYINDQSAETKNRLSIVFSNAGFGLILVLIVLFIFLNFKTALWTALGLPVAIFLATIFIFASGITINSVSLTGIIIVLGMLVDDAIIISENIFRLKKSGLSAKKAALIGAHTVSKPVATTITTTIIVFIPLLFIPGMIGDFAYEIPVVISFTLLASMFEAFFILPQHLAHALKNKKRAKVRKNKDLFQGIEKQFRKALRFALRHRYLVVLTFILLFIVAGWYAATNMKFVMFDNEHKQARVFYISGTTKQGSSLKMTSDIVKKIDRMLLALPKNVIQSFKSQIGISLWDGAADLNHFSMLVYMTPANERKITAREITKKLQKKISKIKTITKLQMQIDAGGPPVGKPIEIEITGVNDKERKKALHVLKKVLKSTNFKGLIDIEISNKTSREELLINLNHNKIARYKLNAFQVADTIRTAFNGSVVTYIQTPEERVGYRVILSDNFRRNRRTLKKIRIANDQNRLIPLLTLLHTKEQKAVKKIRHYNGERNISITANIDPKITTPIAIFEKLKPCLQKLQQNFTHTRFAIKGEAEESSKIMITLLLSFGIAIIAIYVLLILLFNSFSQPMLVMTAIPFSLIGVIAAFALHGSTINMFGMIGVIGLTGVVVNDSLVLVDFINHNRKQKKEKDTIKSIIEGTAARLRPVLLTTITTAAGLLPTAYGVGGYDFTVSPITLVISWGLIFATTLTLFLVPALYLIEQDIKNLFKRKK